MKQADYEKQLLKKSILSDLEVVVKQAQYLVEIFSDHCEVTKEPDGLLGVIAIIGEAHSPVLGKIDRALLCEIGIGIVRPYRVAEVPKDKKDKHHANSIKARRIFLEMNRQQYEIVAPVVFDLLQKISAQKIAEWKNNNSSSYVVKVPTTRWKKTGIKPVERYRDFEVSPYTRFSFSVLDSFFISDIFYAEIFANKAVVRHLESIAGKIAIPLRHYFKIRTQRSLKTLKRYDAIVSIIKNTKHPDYLIKKVFDYMEKDLRSYFSDDLDELLGMSKEKSPEEIWAQSALPLAEFRLKGIEIRNSEVFSEKIRSIRVFPSKAHLMEAEIKLRSKKAELFLDDIPF